MIRIDEIYYNVFVSALQDRPHIGLHWFEPFGTTDFEHLSSMPAVNYFDATKRIIFWDQEPLHREQIDNFFARFISTFRKPEDNHHYDIHIVTSEYESDNVRYVCDTYNVKPSYYFFNAWAALDWYRGYDRTHLYKPFVARDIQKTFLCPNNVIGGKRKHRLMLLDELVDRELVKNNLISFPERCPYENKKVSELCEIYGIHLGHVDLPLIIDNGNDHSGDSHKIDLWQYAEKTLLQVVTETVYDGRRKHLTEKSFKPIVMQQPFVLVSCQGSLEYLRSYGFKTFGDFWNEDYDEKDDDSRMLSIGKLLSDLDGLSIREKKDLQRHLASVVEYNFNWFYSKEYEDLLWKEITCMIDQW